MARVESLGRPAVFFVPTIKIEGTDTEKELEAHLVMHYGGYTKASGVFHGCWWNVDLTIISDMHVQYTVAFWGKEKVQPFLDYLGELATKLGEDCIYVETGEDAWLVFPD